MPRGGSSSGCGDQRMRSRSSSRNSAQNEGTEMPPKRIKTNHNNNSSQATNNIFNHLNDGVEDLECMDNQSSVPARSTRSKLPPIVLFNLKLQEIKHMLTLL